MATSYTILSGEASETAKRYSHKGPTGIEHWIRQSIEQKNAISIFVFSYRFAINFNSLDSLLAPFYLLTRRSTLCFALNEHSFFSLFLVAKWISFPCTREARKSERDTRRWWKLSLLNANWIEISLCSWCEGGELRRFRFGLLCERWKAGFYSLTLAHYERFFWIVLIFLYASTVGSDRAHVECFDDLYDSLIRADFRFSLTFLFTASACFFFGLYPPVSCFLPIIIHLSDDFKLALTVCVRNIHHFIRP